MRVASSLQLPLDVKDCALGGSSAVLVLVARKAAAEHHTGRFRQDPDVAAQRTANQLEDGSLAGPPGRQ